MDINTIITDSIKSYIHHPKRLLKIKCVLTKMYIDGYNGSYGEDLDNDFDESDVNVKTRIGTFIVEVENELNIYADTREPIYFDLKKKIDGDNDIKLYKSYKLYGGEVIDLKDFLIRETYELNGLHDLQEEIITTVFKTKWIN